MKLIERFKQGKFVITCEAGPPKGIEIKGLLDELESLRNKVDAFNVTDLQLCDESWLIGHLPSFEG